MKLPDRRSLTPPLGTLRERKAHATRSHWDAQEIAESGAVFTAEQLNAAVHTLENGNAEELTRNILTSMVTPAMSKEQFEWIVECNQRLPRAIAQSAVPLGQSPQHCYTTIFIQTGAIKLSGFVNQL